MVYQPQNPVFQTPEQKHASAVLERIIHGNPMPHGDPTHSQFLNAAQVKISTQFNQGNIALQNPNMAQEVLDIAISDPHVENSPKAVGNFVAAQLEKIPALKDRLHFHSAKEEQKELTGTLEKLIAGGAPIPPDFKDWPGFNESNGQVEKHAVSVQRTDGDVSMEIRIPKKAKMSAQAVADDVQKRLPQIKDVLAERLSKYTVGDTQKSKAAILAKLNTMEFSTSVNEHEWWTQVRVGMKSPEQVAALKQPGGIEAYPDKAALRATNILNGISDTDANPQLQKALARAVFTAGNPSPAVVAAVLGRDDMHVYLAKALKSFSAQKPELAKDVETLLKSDTLKENSWRSDEEPKADAKGTIAVIKSDKDTGKVHVQLSLPADYSALQAIKDIAALDPTLAPQFAGHAQPAPTFAQVDRVELVGASSPQAYQYAQQVLAQHQPQHSPQQVQAVANTLNGHAEKVLGYVEQAHNEILQAVNEAARQFQQQAPKPDTMITAHQVQRGNPGAAIHP